MDPIRNIAKTLFVASLACFASWGSCAADQPVTDPGSAQSPTFTPNGHRVGLLDFTLPFYLFNGHILIDGAVNGRPGKFMFDTGTEFPFLLNNHFLPLSKDQLVGQGHAASGQDIVIYRQKEPVASIEIGAQIRFENVPALLHADWGFLEQAYTSHFLGSIGHGFNRNYLFVVDYDAQTITFHALNQEESVLARVIDPARVLATLHFTPIGVDGKMPEVDMQIGDETLTAFFDTGNSGTLELTEHMKNTLERKGKLTLTASDHTYGSYEASVRGTLQGLSYSAQPLGEIRNLLFTSGTRDRVGLGYHFLKNYITVWDYSRRTLTLLKP